MNPNDTAEHQNNFFVNKIAKLVATLPNLESVPQVPTTTLIPLRIAGRLSMMNYENVMQKQTRKQKILKIHLVL